MAWGAIFIIYFNKAFLGVIVYCVFLNIFPNPNPNPIQMVCYHKMQENTDFVNALDFV